MRAWVAVLVVALLVPVWVTSCRSVCADAGGGSPMVNQACAAWVAHD